MGSGVGGTEGYRDSLGNSFHKRRIFFCGSWQGMEEEPFGHGIQGLGRGRRKKKRNEGLEDGMGIRSEGGKWAFMSVSLLSGFCFAFKLMYILNGLYFS